VITTINEGEETSVTTRGDWGHDACTLVSEILSVSWSSCFHRLINYKQQQPANHSTTVWVFISFTFKAVSFEGFS
jgi:hypothetical protein